MMAYTQGFVTVAAFLVCALSPSSVVAHTDEKIPTGRLGGHHHHHHGGCDPKSKGYDYLMLVMQWPPTYGVTDVSHWTIHGLWPSRVGDAAATYPCTCTKQHFDPDAVSDLRADMEYYWPSLMGKSSTGFWTHEWTKHGTCTTLHDEHKYFSSTLSLRKAMNPDAALHDAGIVPSTDIKYTYANILAAVKTKYGHAPLLGCEMKKGEQHLKEIGMCFGLPDPDALQECEASVRRIRDEVNDCDATLDIWYTTAAAAEGGSGTNAAASIE